MIEPRAQRYPLRTPRRAGFLSLDRLAMQIIATDLGFPATGLLVYLIARADVQTGIVKTSIRELAAECPNLSRNTLTKYLCQLEEAERISVARGFNGDSETRIQVLNWAWLLCLDVDPSGSDSEPPVEPARSEFEPPVEPLDALRPATSGSLDTRDFSKHPRQLLRRGAQRTRTAQEVTP